MSQVSVEFSAFGNRLVDLRTSDGISAIVGSDVVWLMFGGFMVLSTPCCTMGQITSEEEAVSLLKGKFCSWKVTFLDKKVLLVSKSSNL